MVRRVARDLRRFVIAMLVSHLPSSPPRAASQGKPALDYCAGGERLLRGPSVFCESELESPVETVGFAGVGFGKSGGAPASAGRLPHSI